MPATIVPQVVLDARLKAGLDTDNVTNAQALTFANEIYQSLMDEKKKISEDFLHKTAYTNTIAYTNQYTLPTDLEKILLLSVKYQAPTYNAWVTLTVYKAGDKVTNSGKAYISVDNHTAGATFVGDVAHWTQLREGYSYATPKKLDYTEMNWNNDTMSATYPVFYLMENKINIYPWVEEIVVEGIKYDYIQRLASVTLTTDDADLYIEDKWLKAWELGIAYKMQDFCTVDSSKNQIEYERAKSDARTRRANRYMNKVTEELPPLYNYRR